MRRSLIKILPVLLMLNVLVILQAYTYSKHSADNFWYILTVLTDVTFMLFDCALNWTRRR